jgi:hypothetical protein
MADTLYKHRLYSLLCCIGLISPLKVVAADDMVDHLYDGLLKNNNSCTFVCFERQIVIPASPPAGKTYVSPNGAQIITPQATPQYVAFCREGSRFITAFSQGRRLEKPSDLTLADTLTGFDGSNYWRLTLNSPIQLRSPAQMTNLDAPPTLSYNNLTIIPNTEVGRPDSDVKPTYQLLGIRGFMMECLSVVQLGFDRDLLSVRPIGVGTLGFQSSSNTGPVIVNSLGEAARPTELQYPAFSGITTTAILDHRKSMLTIKRSFNGSVSFEARYHLLAVGPAAFTVVDPYSWQTYKNSATNLQPTLIHDGASFEARVTESNSIIVGKMLHPAVTRAKTRSVGLARAAVFSMFIVLTIAAGIMCTKRFHGGTDRTNTNNRST